MKEIKSKIILLRHLAENDAEFLYTHVSNPNVRKQLRQLPDPYLIEHAHEFISKTLSDSESGDEFHFAVELVETRQITGVIGSFYPGENRDVAEIGYWLGEEFWGRGFATEAVKLFTEFLRKEKNVKSFVAHVFENNFGSIRVLEKNGFISAGLAREQYCNALNNAPLLELLKEAEPQT